MSKTKIVPNRTLQLLGIFSLLAGAVLPACGQELSILTGVTKEIPTNDNSFAWVADYSEPINKIFSYSLVYVNEGHLIDHHRDGMGGQIWAGYSLTPKWSVKVGWGPYLYFDTAAKPAPVIAGDDHGIGAITSLATTFQYSKHWGLELRANRILTKNSIDTTSIVAGLRYQYDASVLPGSSAGADWWRIDSQTPNEVTVYAGRTYVNNFESETATAYGMEYRRNLSRHLEWTAGALREGNPGPIDRTGVMSEIWGTRTVLNNHAVLGVGIGPYIGYDSRDNDRARLSGVLSITGAVKLPGNLVARATWHRVATSYNRDTDVFLFGVGYRW